MTRRGDFTRECQLRPHCVEAVHVHACARDLSDGPTLPGPDGHRTFQTLPKGVCLSCPVCPVTGLVGHHRTLSAVSGLSGVSGRRGGLPSFFHHSLEFVSRRSAIATHRDQQSWSLLAFGTSAIVFSNQFSFSPGDVRGWECHGKIGRARYPWRSLHASWKSTPWGKILDLPRKFMSPLPIRRRSQTSFRFSRCVVAARRCLHRPAQQFGGVVMKREKVTFEAEPELKTTLEDWARAEDRSVGSLLRRIVERAAQERRAASAATGEAR